MSRAFLPIAFGAGLDRESGVLSVRPTAMRDVRNSVLHEGRAQARLGMTAVATLVDEFGAELTDVCGIFAMREEGAAIAVGYSSADRRVHVLRLNGDGTTPEWVGVWFTQAAGLGVPRVTAAEVVGKLYLAHDEPKVTRRAATYVYDPRGSIYLSALTADLDQDASAEELKFRGVVAHLSYLIGWGFGTGTAPAGPQVLRNDTPGSPGVFAPNEYGQFGQAGEPIVACVSHAAGLLVLKEVGAFILRGYSRQTFTEELLDAGRGVGGSRLAGNFAGSVYGWDNDGPWVWDGGGSVQDISLPLDLGAPLPSDLVAAGELVDGFVEYLADEQKVQFVFGELVYSLSIRTVPKWDFWELGREAFCGARLYGALADAPPTGHPEADATADIMDSTATVGFTNIDADGDETVEVWLKRAGTWSRKVSVGCNGLASQTVGLSGLYAGTAYDVAFRYRRGTSYTAGYTSADPDDWPAISRGSFTTTITAPTIASSLWERTSAISTRIALSFTLADPAERLEVMKDGVSAVILAPGVDSWDDVDPVLGAEYSYVAHHLAVDDTPGPDSDPVAVFAGPPAPTIIGVWSTSSSFGNAEFVRNTSDPDVIVEQHQQHASGGAFFLQVEYEVAWGNIAHVEKLFVGDEVPIKLRNRITAFGVDDYSAYAEDVVPICTGCPA